MPFLSHVVELLRQLECSPPSPASAPPAESPPPPPPQVIFLHFLVQSVQLRIGHTLAHFLTENIFAIHISISIIV